MTVLDPSRKLHFLQDPTFHLDGKLRHRGAGAWETPDRS